MDNVKSATEVHFNSVINDLINFECNNAFETEGLECDRDIVKKAIEDIYKNSDNGEYFLYMNPENPNEVCGSAFVTYEDEKTWWIQSVYVSDKHRRKGIFSALFDKILEKAKKNGVEKIQLCVCKDNERAKKAYYKVGMSQNKLEYYGIDLIYGESEVPEEIETPISSDFEVEEDNHEEPIPELEKFLGCPVEGKKSLVCFFRDQIIGWCQYVEEFDVWRGSTVFSISALYFKPGFIKHVIENFMKFLISENEDNVGGVRFIGSEDELEKVERINEKMEHAGYSIMEIEL